jgi:ribulose-5-phosphate 4-epimerase/fuculose-1-phosphate aldolase
MCPPAAFASCAGKADGGWPERRDHRRRSQARERTQGRPKAGAIDSGEAAIRRDIAVACRILADAGQGDSIYGHVAGRLPGSARFWMKAGGMGMEEASASNLVIVDVEQANLGRSGTMHREWPIHAAIFAARLDVAGIVHTHPKFGIALGASGQGLRALNQDSFPFHDNLPVFSRFAHLVETMDDGRAVAEELGGARALLLVNHGVVVVGEDVATATCAALMLERACELAILSPGGRAASLADAKAVAASRLAGTRSVFEYHARRLGIA